MAPQTDYIVVNPDGPCPCRSGRITVACCMATDGSFRVKFPAPLPPGEITGFSHANCYMRDTRNCSAAVATGYYFSNGVRELLRTQVVAVTFPWAEGGEGAVPGVEDLAAGLLCDRHNAAMTPLDAVALQAFRNILDGVAYVTMKSLATKKTLTAVSGEGLELWVLKLLFGASQNRLTAELDVAVNNFQSLDLSIFLTALKTGALADPRGLYIRKSRKENSHGRDTAYKTNGIAGVFITIGPLECELIVDPTGIDADAMRSHTFYRPSGLDLVGRKRSAQIHLSGPGFATNETARLALTDTRSPE